MKKFAALFLGAVLATSAAAADRNIPVHFAHGAYSAEYHGIVKGYDVHHYTFTARKGQKLIVKIRSNNADAVLYGYDDFMADEPYTLPENGRYEVRVLQPRSFARRNAKTSYRVNIAIH